jgi:hypothetical protein
MKFTPIQAEDDELDERSRMVCVCRAVEEYIDVQTFFLKTIVHSSLFFSKDRESKPAAKQTIASGIKACVHEAYKRMESTPHVKAHSTRKQSMTWAALKKISICDICKMVTWSSSNVFIKHYKLKVHDSVSSRHTNAVLKARH